jgi:hypothetical protein
MRILCKDGERERERRGVDVVRLGTIKMVFSCSRYRLCCIMFVFGKERDLCGSFVR